LFNPPKLCLEKIALELFVGVVMLKFPVHVDIAVETPVPILADHLLQGRVGHSRTLEELQEPVGCGQNHVVVIAVVVGGRINLLNPGDLVWPMLLRESRNATIGELFDPMSGLPHPILDGYGEARASSVAVEYIPFRAFFSGQGGAVVDESCPEEFEFFPLCVALPRPLFAILPVLTLPLLKGADETPRDVSDRVEVVCDLDGGRSSAG
jgi:hypothetical protein